MEITSKNFWELLPVVLEAMAAAEHISIDIEMTGIFAKNIDVPRNNALAATYRFAKEAAERFQIVQFGMTCMTSATSPKEFRCRTFNFILTPSFMGNRPVDKRLAKMLDRYVGLSQSTVMFLREHDFEMSRAFRDGISYLSRSEVRELQTGVYLNPNGRDGTKPRLNLADFDKEATDFQKYVRQSIHEWYTSRPRRSHVNVRNTHSGRMNSLQVPIVSELVKHEYPNCKCFPKANQEYMQIVMRDQKDDDRVLQDRCDAICRYKGFSFVVEALVGRLSLEMLPFRYLIPANASDRHTAIDDMKARLYRLQDKINGGNRTIVGHNSFYDLCFVYQSFVGPLPDTVEQFGQEIKFLLPRFVDTKYLARRPGNHSMLPDESLAELFWKVRKNLMPTVIKDPSMPLVTRGDNKLNIVAHQAGYDSYMTAFVYLKYAWDRAQVEARRQAASETEKSKLRKIEDYADDLAKKARHMDLNFETDDWKKHQKFERTSRQTRYNPDVSEPSIAPLLTRFPPVPPKRPDGTMNPNTSWLLPATPSASPEKKHQSRPTSSSTVSTSLLDMSDDEAAAKVSAYAPLIPDGKPSPLPTVQECVRGIEPRDGPTTSTEHYTSWSQYSIVVDHMPVWEDRVWREYGNKIKVGAGVLDLDGC